MKAPIKSFEIIKKVYERFVKTYRDLDPKLMICEKEDFDNVETTLKDYERVMVEKNDLFKRWAKEHQTLEIIKEHPEQLLDIIGTDNYNEYLDLDYAPNQYMSEENYYLLKEVLL